MTAALEELDQYLLLEELGGGGMGTVFKARHQVMNRIVAIKVIHPRHVQDPQAVRRFLREIHAIAALDHPNIVRAYDAREVNGTHFLVMEYLEGIDLARLVQSVGPLKLADACTLVRQAALGLEHAHEHGLVHRDVKPSNLMLTRAGQVKVLDLGLARLRAEPPAGAEITPAGFAVGTPDYIAPEQVRDARAVDIRADLYSLGCTLYHLLAGEPPFSGPTYPSLGSKMLAHCYKPFPSIRAIRPELPEPVLPLLERLVAKDPAARFATPAAVAAALKPLTANCDLDGLLAAVDLTPQIRTSEETLPPHPTLADPAAAPAPRRWRWPHWAVAAALVSGLLLAIGSTVYHWRGREPEAGAQKGTVIQNPPGSTGETAQTQPRAVRRFKSEREVLTQVRDHLLTLPTESRKYQRYFTLTHLHNNLRLFEPELEVHRGLLERLAAGRGEQGAVILPKVIDPERTLFAMDLRAIRWDPHDTWTELLKHYPYGLRYDHHADEELRELATQVYGLSECNLPIVRGDWLSVAAPRELHGKPLFQAPPADKDDPRRIPLPEMIRAGKELYDEDLDIETVATELGLADVNLLMERIHASHHLQTRGLGPLTEGETIPRWKWSSMRFAVSLFQNVAQELGLGTPYVAY